jgi:hypothetical protein
MTAIELLTAIVADHDDGHQFLLTERVQQAREVIAAANRRQRVVEQTPPLPFGHYPRG